MTTGRRTSLVFIAILAKRFGIRPAGWERVAAPFSDAEPRSVADVDSPESLARVREWKKMMKAAHKAKLRKVRLRTAKVLKLKRNGRLTST